MNSKGKALDNSKARIAKLIACLFLVGIAWAVWSSLCQTSCPPLDMPGVVVALLSALNVALALNLGVVLGVSVVFGYRMSRQGKNGQIQEILAWGYGIAWAVASTVWLSVELFGDLNELVAILPEVSERGVQIFVAAVFVLLSAETVKEAIRSDRGNQSDPEKEKPTQKGA